MANISHIQINGEVLDIKDASGGGNYITVHNGDEEIQIPHSVIDELLDEYSVDPLGVVQAARWLDVFKSVGIGAINHDIVAGGGVFVCDEPDGYQDQQYFWKTPTGTYAYISTFNDYTKWRVWNVTDIYIIE